MRKGLVLIWTLLIIALAPIILFVALMLGDSPASYGIPTIIILVVSYGIAMLGYTLIDKFIPAKQLENAESCNIVEQKQMVGKGIPKRALANFIDSGILIIFFLFADKLLFSIIHNNLFFLNTFLIQLVVSSCGYFGYYFIFEKLYQATPGKMIVGLQVVMIDEIELTRAAVFYRSIFKMIDVQLCYVLSIVSILLSDRKQSFGDQIAHTLVVDKKDSVIPPV